VTTKEKSWKEASQAGVCWRSSTTYLTGDWKTYKPERDMTKCTKCLICTLYCPDGAIRWDPKKGDIEFDLNYCKGCGICANECPTKAIVMKIE
jgi:pyruvate ferredoxin oxidoreductase delta subunit